MATKIRFIDTAGLPPGYDVADLINAGTTGDALIAWCRERVRDGLPPAEARPEPVRAAQQKTPGAKGGDTGGQGLAVAPAGENRRTANIPVAEAPSTPAVVNVGNVVTLERPQPRAQVDLDPSIPPEFSDDSLAERFAERYHEDMVFVPTWGRWMQWTGHIWQHDELLHAFHLSRRICREAGNEATTRPDLASKARSIATALTSARTISNVERVARSDPRVVAGTKQWDRDPWALNTPGGLVDLQTGSMRPARKDDFVTKSTIVAPGGACPTWLEFLNVATAGDKPMQEYLRRVAGYCLTGITREHALFFVYGLGGNGKGTFLNTLQWILDAYARTANMDMFVEQKFQSHPTDVAGLMGARMVTAQETEEGKRWNESRLKSFTGGDPLTARFMRQDEFTFIPEFKLVFAGNHRPNLKNVDDAIKRRLHMIPFDVVIPPERKDPNLPMKLRAEAGGILQWCIDGAIDWNDNMLAPPERVTAETQEYFEQEDTIGQFLEECCEFSRHFTCKTSDLYARYGRWCESSNEYALPRKRWLQQLAHRNMESRKVSGDMVMEGLRLRSDKPMYGRRASDDPNGF